jgi:hypothetical protein
VLTALLASPLHFPPWRGPIDLSAAPEILTLVASLTAILAGAIVTGALAAPAMARAARDLPRGVPLALLLATALAAALRLAVTPGFIHENFHAQLIMERIVDAPRSADRMEKGYAVLYQALLGPLGFSERALFALQLLFGVATVPLVGLVAALAIEEKTGACTALLLAANPMHARLSASEDPVVPFLFLLASGTLALLVAVRPADAANPRARAPAALLLYAGFAFALLMHLRTDFAVYLLVPAALVAAAPGALRRLNRPAAYVAAYPIALALWLILPEVLWPSTDSFHFARLGTFLPRTGLPDYYQPDQVLLLSAHVSPLPLLLLALVGFAALLRRPRLGVPLLLLAAGYVVLFLASNGYANNVRAQAPYHLLFLVAAGAGTAWLVRVAADRARTAGVIVALLLGATVAGASVHPMRELSRAASPRLEWRFLADTLASLPIEPRTTLVRPEGVDDDTVNTPFPDYRFRHGLPRIELESLRRFLDGERRLDDAALRDVLYYRGLACYIEYHPNPIGGGAGPLCHEIERRFRLIPVVETHIENAEFDSHWYYPPVGAVPSFPVGFYRLERRP